MIVCGNAPNIVLRLKAGLTVTERGRRRYPPRTVFLDGVFAGAPFYDNVRLQYSLDHHADCVRSFTLATCEQAAVMLIQGMPLFEGSWTLWVNSPDIDAMLAAWLLMNHAELRRDGASLLRKVMPLVRLEGVIDAHGFGKELLAALSEELIATARAQLDTLVLRERECRVAGEFETVRFALDQLGNLDRLLMPPALLKEFTEFVELDWAHLPGGRLAILCRSEHGLYEVEAYLRQRYQDRVAILLLDKGAGVFSLKLSDTFLKKDFRPFYRLLNRIDPQASKSKTSANLWGGSAIIGGSPREKGSGLSGLEIMEAVRKVYGHRPTLFHFLNKWIRVQVARIHAHVMLLKKTRVE
jgi:hypothetical protein